LILGLRDGELARGLVGRSVLGGAAMDELVVRSGLLLISAVLFIAIAAAIFRAFTRKDK